MSSGLGICFCKTFQYDCGQCSVSIFLSFSLLCGKETYPGEQNMGLRTFRSQVIVRSTWGAGGAFCLMNGVFFLPLRQIKSLTIRYFLRYYSSCKVKRNMSQILLRLSVPPFISFLTYVKCDDLLLSNFIVDWCSLHLMTNVILIKLVWLRCLNIGFFSFFGVIFLWRSWNISIKGTWPISRYPMGHSIFCRHPPPPPLLRDRDFWGGGEGSLRPFLWGIYVGTSDLLINSEGEVCWLFELLFLGVKSSLFWGEGWNIKYLNREM